MSESATLRSASRTSGGSRRRRGNRAQGLVIGVLSVLVLVALFPYLFMLVTSFKSQDQFTESYWAPTWPLHLENYATAWTQIQPYFITSMVVAIAAILLTLALATVTGYVFAQFDFFGRRALFVLIAVLLMVPSISSLIPLFLMMRDLGLLNTYVVLIIPHVATSTVLGIVLMRNFVEGISPSLFEAARLDGAGGVRIFRSLVLPLALPVVGTITLITVINVWNDYFWPLLTVTQNDLRNIAVGISFFQGQNATLFGPLFAGYVLASVPLIILFAFMSKYFLAGVQGGITVDR